MDDGPTMNDAEAYIEAKTFPFTRPAPKGAERSTMTESTIITPEALVDGSDSPLDLERPDKAPYLRVRANGKTLAYATQRSDGFVLELYGQAAGLSLVAPQRFQKMLNPKGQVRVTSRNLRGARSLMEWLAAKVA